MTDQIAKDFTSLSDEDLSTLLGTYRITRNDTTPPEFNGYETPHGSALVEEIQRRLKASGGYPSVSPDSLPRIPFIQPLDGSYNNGVLVQTIKRLQWVMEELHKAGGYPLWWPALTTGQKMLEEVLLMRCRVLRNNGAIFEDYMIVFPEENNKVLKGINDQGPAPKYPYQVFFFIAKKADEKQVLENEE